MHIFYHHMYYNLQTAYSGIFENLGILISENNCCLTIIGLHNLLLAYFLLGCHATRRDPQRALPVSHIVHGTGALAGCGRGGVRGTPYHGGATQLTTHLQQANTESQIVNYLNLRIAPTSCLRLFSI